MPPYVQSIVKYLQYAVKIPALRNNFPYLAPLMNFFDDYWYYIYQDNNMDNLSATPNFLNVMYQVNNARYTLQFD
jgi:hypothetical protein